MESFHNLMVLQALCSFIGNYFVFPIMQSLKGQLYLEQSAKKVFISYGIAGTLFLDKQNKTFYNDFYM